MGKKILPLFFLSFVFSASFGQLNNALIAYRQGLDFKSKSMFFEAMGSFQKAIYYNKKFDSAYLEVGTIFAKTTTPDSARWYYKKALSLNPKMTVAYIALGNFYRDIRPNYDSALICYFNATKTDSLNKETYYSIAWCYNAKEKNDSAIIYAVKALEIDNTYRSAYNELGHAYNKTKRYKDGIEQFKKNLAISVVDLALLYSGFCYVQLKDKAGAMETYEKLLTVNDRMAKSLKKQIDTLQ